MNAARARRERAVYGFNCNGAPQGYALKRIERATRKLLEPDRAEVARGWRLTQTQIVGFSSGDAQTLPSEKLGTVYLLTDGRQAVCEIGDLGILVISGGDLERSVEIARSMTGGPLVLELQRIAGKAGIDLP